MQKEKKLTEEIIYINIEEVKEPEKQARTVIISEGLEELAASIKGVGIIMPLIVKKIEGGYEITAGHRRYLAAKQIELKEIPCIVRNQSPEAELETKLNENYFREDINPIDEAGFFLKLKNDLHMDITRISRIATKSESYVRARLQLLDGSDMVAAAVQGGQINISQAMVINKTDDTEIIERLLDVAVSHGANARSLITIRDDYEKRLAPVDPESADPSPEQKTHPSPRYQYQCPSCERSFPTTEIFPLSVCKECHDGFMSGIKQERDKEQREGG